MVVIKSDSLEVIIKPHGAELSSVKNTSGTEYIWQAQPEIWPRHAPVLFPVVGKLLNNAYRHNGISYELGQHGFARDMEFKLIEQNNSDCTFELRSNSFTLTKYPFDFGLNINYSLLQNQLTVRYQIHNPTSSVLPFSIGGHPGFNCPMHEGEVFEDYYLQFEAEMYDLTVLESGLRLNDKNKIQLGASKKLWLSTGLFDNDALVFENNQINTLSLCSQHHGEKIRITCANWPYFGVWGKKGCRKFVCLEPWYGVADGPNAIRSLSEKKGVILLEAGASFSCSFELMFF